MSYKLCKKFEPNRFSRIRCQNCFSAKNQHSSEALEQASVDVKAAHCGYLFISQDSDFSTDLARGRRWIRRYFVVFTDAHLKYFLDENVEGIPLADFDLHSLCSVEDAEIITTHTNSIVLRFATSEFFIKGVSKDEIRRWREIFMGFMTQPQSKPIARSKSSKGEDQLSAHDSWSSSGKSEKAISLKKPEHAREIDTRSNLYGDCAELEGLFYQKSGWLMVKDGNEWLKCWCKLKNGQLSLKMEGANDIDKLIDVKRCSTVDQLSLAFSYGFVLETETETLTFAATTESSRDSWQSMLYSVIGHVSMGFNRSRSPMVCSKDSGVESVEPSAMTACDDQAISSLQEQISALQLQLSQVQTDFQSHYTLYCGEKERSIEHINSLENTKSELTRRLEDVLEQFDKLSEEKDQIERSYLQATKLLEQRTEMYEMLKERAAKMSPISDDEPSDLFESVEGTYPQISPDDLKDADKSTVETLLAIVKARDINIAFLKSRLSDVSKDLDDFHEQLMVSIENYKSTEDRLRADNERIARMVSKSLEEIERDETTGGCINDCKLIHDLKVALCVKDFETQRLRAHVLMLEDEISLVLAHEEKTMRMYRLCLHEKNELTGLYNLRLAEIRK